MKKEVIIGLIVFILGLLSFFIDGLLANFFKNISFASNFLSAFQPIMVLGMFIILIILISWQNKKKYVKPLILSLILTGITSFLLKIIISRPRPLGLIELFPLIGIVDSSFPSMHAAIMFSMLPVLDKEFPRFKWFWLVISLLVAFSRVYLGFHYLSDVVFGGLIGYLIGFYYINKLVKKKKSK